MEDIYEDFGRQKYHLNLIQYYALYDPNGEQGLIQGLRYYPRNINTVIPNNPKLKTTINYYKPYTEPKVVLPKPRYIKKLSSLNKDKKILDKKFFNTLAENNYLNQQNMDNTNLDYLNKNNNINHNRNINNNNDCYRTFRRSYSIEKE